jgi:hypothetical protein
VGGAGHDGSAVKGFLGTEICVSCWAGLRLAWVTLAGMPAAFNCIVHSDDVTLRAVNARSSTLWPSVQGWLGPLPSSALHTASLASGTRGAASVRHCCALCIHQRPALVTLSSLPAPLPLPQGLSVPLRRALLEEAFKRAVASSPSLPFHQQHLSQLHQARLLLQADGGVLPDLGPVGLEASYLWLEKVRSATLVVWRKFNAGDAAPPATAAAAAGAAGPAMRDSFHGEVAVALQGMGVPHTCERLTADGMLSIDIAIAVEGCGGEQGIAVEVRGRARALLSPGLSVGVLFVRRHITWCTGPSTFVAQVPEPSLLQLSGAWFECSVVLCCSFRRLAPGLHCDLARTYACCQLTKACSRSCVPSCSLPGKATPAMECCLRLSLLLESAHPAPADHGPAAWLCRSTARTITLSTRGSQRDASWAVIGCSKPRAGCR